MVPSAETDRDAEEIMKRLDENFNKPIELAKPLEFNKRNIEEIAKELKLTQVKECDTIPELERYFDYMISKHS